MKKKVKVECLYCLEKVFIPKLKGFEYTKWPIMHEKHREHNNAVIKSNINEQS